MGRVGRGTELERERKKTENVNDSEQHEGDRRSSCIQFNSQLILTLTACGSSKENATSAGKMRREERKKKREEEEVFVIRWYA